MSIEDPNIVDAVGVEPGTGHGMMVIADDLDWSDPVRHLFLIQEKIKTYVGFAQSGQLRDALPDDVARPPKIAIIQRFEPPADMVPVLNALGEALARLGIAFGYGPLPEGHEMPA